MTAVTGEGKLSGEACSVIRALKFGFFVVGQSWLIDTLQQPTIETEISHTLYFVILNQ